MRGGRPVIEQPAGGQEEGAGADAANGGTLSSLCAKEVYKGGIVANRLFYVGAAEGRDEEEVEAGAGIQRKGLVSAIYIGMAAVIDDGDAEEGGVSFFFIEAIDRLEYIQYGRHAQEAVILCE